MTALLSAESENTMPYEPSEIVQRYAAGETSYPNGEPLAPDAAAAWDAVRRAGTARLGSSRVRDSARREWVVEPRRDGARGRFLVFSPLHADLEPFRASADGYRTDTYLPVAVPDWTLLAILAAGRQGDAGREDEELRTAAFRLVDRMVRDAQHRSLMGAAEDEDDEGVMPGPIFEFLAADHARLDALLSGAVAPGQMERGWFDEFREGLLRHIAIEEKILLPAAREARGGEPLPQARQLRIDHGAIAALLVPTPTPEIAAEIRKILGPHNLVEEGQGGVYETCDALLAHQSEAILGRMRAYPRVKVARYQDGPRVCRTAEEALRVSALQSERRR